MNRKNIDVALRVSEILSNLDHEVHVVLRSPKEGSNLKADQDLIVIPITDTATGIYGKYETVELSKMYELFKTINTGVSSIEGSPEQLSMYYGSSGSGTVIGKHECGYVVDYSQLNEFKNHCKIKFIPKGYIYVVTIDDINNKDSVVSAIENIVEIA